jgi:hypothetical protein
MSRPEKTFEGFFGTLALTDQQIHVVQSAARALPIKHRPNFLNAIAVELTDHKTITDADLSAAIAEATHD